MATQIGSGHAVRAPSTHFPRGQIEHHAAVDSVNGVAVTNYNSVPNDAQNPSQPTICETLFKSHAARGG